MLLYYISFAQSRQAKDSEWHGWGSAKGTIAEGWSKHAVAFWEKQMKRKFVQHFTESFGDNTENFVEENGRKLFLLYIRPLINGSGNYYIESRTRSMGRTDLIIDYLGVQYIVEMKIWHGQEYNTRGENQLIGYLKDYGLKKGYMLSFNFNKNKTTGVQELHFKEYTIVEAVV